MADILFYGGMYGYIILSGVLQFFIAKSDWHIGKRYLASIGLFLFMLVIHIVIYIILLGPSYRRVAEEDVTAAAGFGFGIAFLSIWILGLAIFSGVVQILTATLVWAIRFIRKKKELNGGMKEE